MLAIFSYATVSAMALVDKSNTIDNSHHRLGLTECTGHGGGGHILDGDGPTGRTGHRARSTVRKGDRACCRVTSGKL